MNKDVDKEINILLVEDDFDNIQITKRAFKKIGINSKVWIVNDGEQALDFLYRRRGYKEDSKAAKPDLILLDMNLPRINGLEVLKEIKNDADLKKIPVIMLTVSGRREDVVRAYDLGCNSYVKKPVSFERFEYIVKQIGIYWGTINLGSP